jgi:hypothetical protein
LLAGPAATEPDKQSTPQPNEIVDALTIPCDVLPGSAIRVVPSPLDQYVTLVCTSSGQALKPIKAAWMFDQGALWPSAGKPSAPSKTDHYTALAYKPLGADELAALRAELAKLHPAPDVLTRSILRFAVNTSWGAQKELYLLPPPDAAGPDARTVGMECIHGCRPVDKDPWFFTIVPDK